MNIICTTDLSPASAGAADAAAALASKLSEKLLLLHVLESNHSADESLRTSIRTSAELRLFDEAARLRQTGVEIEQKLIESSPVEGIMSQSENRGMDLLVMASQKRRSLPSRWFDGGLVERIVKQAEDPVLVVRDPAPVQAWVSGGKVLNLFVAIDLTPASDITLQWVRELVSQGHCSVTIGYLNWVADEVIRLGLPQSTLFEGSRQLQSLLEQELQEKVQRIFGDIPFGIWVEARSGNACEQIRAKVSELQADLVVVGTRQRGAFARFWDESVALGMLHDASANLMLVPLRELSEPVEIPRPFRVMVPCDFSDVGRLALRHARSIIAPGGIIFAVHLIDQIGMTSEEAEKRLREMIESLPQEDGIRYETFVDTGLPKDGIRQLASRLRVDAICMGKSGRSGLARAMGSVASAVVTMSTHPVYLIPA